MGRSFGRLFSEPRTLAPDPGQKPGPLFHEFAPTLEQIGAPVGGFHPVRVHVGQRQLAHLAGGVGALRGPVPEARSEPVRNRANPEVADHLGRGFVLFSFLP